MAEENKWMNVHAKRKMSKTAEVITKKLNKNKFYETTPFEGFGFINESKTKKQTIFWYVVVSVFLAITIIGVAKLTIDYLSGPTKTVVHLSTAEKDNLPGFYIIFGVTPMEFAPWKEIENQTDRFTKFNQEEISKQFTLSINGNTTELLNFWYYQNSNCSTKCTDWEERVGFVPDKYELLLFMVFRLYFLQPVPQDYSNIQTFLPMLENITNATAVVESGAKLGLSMTEIIEKVSVQLTELLGIQLFSMDETLGKPILQGVRLIPIKSIIQLELQFYPKFPENKTVKGVVCNWVLPKIRQLVLERKQMNDSTSFFEFYDKYFKPYYDEKFYFYYKDAKEAGSIWAATVPLTRPFKISTYSFIITGKERIFANDSCFPGTIPEKCLQRCASQVFINLCGCLPWDSYAAFTNPTTLLCDTSKCPKNQTYFEQAAACYQVECNEDNFCETILYRVDNFITEFFRAEYPFGSIRFFIDNAKYPIFELHHAQTLAGFLAELGGQMSAWIGITFIGLLHAITLFGGQLTQKWWRKQDKISDKEHPMYNVKDSPNKEAGPTTTTEISE